MLWSPSAALVAQGLISARVFLCLSCAIWQYGNIYRNTCQPTVGCHDMRRILCQSAGILQSARICSSPIRCSDGLLGTLLTSRSATASGSASRRPLSIFLSFTSGSKLSHGR